ncbi:hypothetical protein J2R89_007106 [Bradyrhizobium elkanii]|nr:hypothetical protein [Bradyrhizobium elkanii]
MTCRARRRAGAVALTFSEPNGSGMVSLNRVIEYPDVWYV